MSLISFGLRKNALYVFVQQKAKALCSQSQAYTWATLYLLTKPKSLKSSLSFLLGHSFMGLEGFWAIIFHDRNTSTIKYSHSYPLHILHLSLLHDTSTFCLSKYHRIHFNKDWLKTRWSLSNSTCISNYIWLMLGVRNCQTHG